MTTLNWWIKGNCILYKLLLFVLVGFHHTSKAANVKLALTIVTEAADTSVVSIYKQDKQGSFRCFDEYLRCLSSGVGRLACLTTYLSALLILLELFVKLSMCICIVKRYTFVLDTNDRDVSFILCFSQKSCLEIYLWISILKSHDGTKAHLWAGLSISLWWPIQETCSFPVRF